MSTNIQFIDHETIEMERDEAEEKCLVQQQVIMDQMKQLKKVKHYIIDHFSLIKYSQLDADIENQDSYYADQVDQEAKRLEEIIWLAERIINIQIVCNIHFSPIYIIGPSLSYTTKQKKN